MSTNASNSVRTTGIILTTAFFLGVHSFSLYNGNVTLASSEQYTEDRECDKRLVTDDRINLVSPFLPYEDTESYYVYDCEKR